MSHPTIASTELQELLEKSESIQIIDVRSGSEFRAGHIPGSINIPHEEIPARLEDVADNKPLVLVCQTGTRANLACASILEHRKNATILDGGLTDWLKAKNPVVIGQKSNWSIERQVRFAAGLLVLVGLSLGHWVSPWLYLISAFIGTGLAVSGITNFCGMGILFSKMPWNQPLKKDLKNVQS